jgi:hypothetical protein
MKELKIDFRAAVKNAVASVKNKLGLAYFFVGAITSDKPNTIQNYGSFSYDFSAALVYSLLRVKSIRTAINVPPVPRRRIRQEEIHDPNATKILKKQLTPIFDQYGAKQFLVAYVTFSDPTVVQHWGIFDSYFGASLAGFFKHNIHDMVYNKNLLFTPPIWKKVGAKRITEK